MPLGDYPNFAACVADQKKKGKSEKSAQKICGYLEQKLAKGAEAIDKIDQFHKIVDGAAVWKSSRKNDLPDAAFAYIEPGGKKDDTGKTTPRSKRHLPHHTSAVKSPTENSTVDKSHLRNALARVDQTSIPSSAKATARGHLIRHARALGVGDYDKKKKEK